MYAWEHIAEAYAVWTGQAPWTPSPGGTPSLTQMENAIYYLEEWYGHVQDLEEGYTGEFAPPYWHYAYDISDEDTVLTSQELIDAMAEEDWLEIYGPMLAGMGITVEEWFAEYGQYITAPDLELAEDIEMTRDKLIDEAYANVGADLDTEQMNMVKTGFGTQYQSTSNINQMISEFDTLINTIDTQTDAQLEGWSDEFYNSWLAENMALTAMGAFLEEEEIIDEEED